jgi:drug/metabolite transporter (DMT)-like permease
VASGLFQAAYCVLLGLAYHEGDLSIVYPLSRGTAPVLMVVWGAWFLGERFSLGGGAGILLVVLGVYVLHLPALTGQALLDPFRLVVGRGSGRFVVSHESGVRGNGTTVPDYKPGGTIVPDYKRRPSQLALTVAVVISLYQLLDKRGTAVWPPWIYACTLYTCLFVWLSLFMPLVRTRAQLAAAWRTDWRYILPVGLLLFLAYALVLAAMPYVHLGYLGAIRNVSIVIGALFGVVFLKEPFGGLRILGAALIVGGVVVIAVGP